MSGGLSVLGLGPGGPEQVTPEATAAIAEASVFFGYGPYLDRLALGPGQRRIASGNRQELARAEAALAAAASGESVCVVSGGDPGVFAMAAAVCEAIETGPAEWRSIDLHIVPGITAMLAAAARVGAPLGHDFCALSLSDNLKPWPVIERRLAAVARAGLAIALYNPVSRARPWQLAAAFDLLRRHLPPTTPVILARAIGRPDERVLCPALAEADPALADMASCVIIGTARTRRVTRPGLADLIYTPRYWDEAP